MAAMQIPASFQAAWGAREQPVKGPKPSLSLERILEAGIAVASRDGLDGVSMAKIAAELNSAAMSLYRYVATKDELLLLMADAAMGLPPDSVTGATTWRAGLLDWGKGLYDCYLANPWALKVPISGPPMTPNNINWLEAALAVLAGTPLGENEKLSCVLLISGYARSQATLIVEMSRGIEGRPRQEEPGLGYWGMLRELAPAARFPHLQPVIEAQEQEDAERALAVSRAGGSGDQTWNAVDELGDEVRFGFERILDGIEALISTRPATRSERPDRRAKREARSAQRATRGGA
jgi:AcrR family transcriptional regulator